MSPSQKKIKIACVVSVITLTAFSSLMSLFMTWNLHVPSSEKNQGTEIERQVGKDVTSQQEKRLIQIGANDGRTGNDAFVRRLLSDPATEAILVEANPQIFQLLRINIPGTYADSHERIKLVNALICENDNEDHTFYVVKDTLKEDFPNAPHWVTHQLSSLALDSVLAGVNHFFELKGIKAQAQKYISAIPMPCTSFLKLIEKAGWSPDVVDILVVDVEGHDAHVVTDAIETPGFLPETIVFEQKSANHLYPREFQGLIEKLEKKGYDTGCQTAEGQYDCGRGDDVVSKLKKG